MEILPGVHEISSVFGDRYVKQYLLAGDYVLLLDTGVAATPESVIFPYMQKAGIAPSRIALAIATHADADHHGGFPAVRDAARTALLACHTGDRELIEDPEALYQKRYNFLSRRHGLGFTRDGMVHCPSGRKMDLVLSGGEMLQLAPARRIQVWHVPGHSDGHLAFYDEKNKALFSGDAVQGGGYPTIDGKMSFGPTYYTVDAYLATVAFLEGKPIEHLYSGHWPAMHGAEVRQFLSATRGFVERADELLLAWMKHRPAGSTLKEMLGGLSPKLGSWPPDRAEFLQFAMYGHVSRLQDRGTLVGSNDLPVVYKLA